MTHPVAVPGYLLAEGPDGPIEYLVTGSGDPVTLFLHGLTGSVPQTRPFGSGVAGTRVFAHLRGHGGTPVPASGPGGYDGLAAEADTVRRVTGASRALGVSLGAGALLRLLTDAVLAGGQVPLERVVLVVPAALDVPDPARAAGHLALAGALDARDPAAAAAALRDGQPAAVRRLPVVGMWARRRAQEVAGTPLPVVLRAFAGACPLDAAGRAALAGVEIPVLVLAQEDDAAHPVQVARDLAAALPRADLVVLPPGGVLWTGRDLLREVVSTFLDDSR